MAQHILIRQHVFLIGTLNEPTVMTVAVIALHIIGFSSVLHIDQGQTIYSLGRSFL